MVYNNKMVSYGRTDSPKNPQLIQRTSRKGRCNIWWSIGINATESDDDDENLDFFIMANHPEMFGRILTFEKVSRFEVVKYPVLDI